MLFKISATAADHPQNSANDVKGKGKNNAMAEEDAMDDEEDDEEDGDDDEDEDDEDDDMDEV